MVRHSVSVSSHKIAIIAMSAMSSFCVNWNEEPQSLELGTSVLMQSSTHTIAGWRRRNSDCCSAD
jgi:hypothetical protein